MKIILKFYLVLLSVTIILSYLSILELRQINLIIKYIIKSEY